MQDDCTTAGHTCHVRHSFSAWPFWHDVASAAASNFCSSSSSYLASHICNSSTRRGSSQPLRLQKNFLSTHLFRQKRVVTGRESRHAHGSRGHRCISLAYTLHCVRTGSHPCSLIASALYLVVAGAGSCTFGSFSCTFLL
ncbi:hypothetical protein BDU57DRAFT_510209 [Ampelomyces quisqualis]|uniref:Uncharacterized protein n=1 Tax=Ampelomyces quisqualis TaxID=50730 RepID=A0A6A5R034_AMPQU|nr:hypothetical protein BDU57DRAFT_510209 [Ampelomyces quisqualis]